MRRKAFIVILSQLLSLVLVGGVSAHSIPGCPAATPKQRATSDVNFSVKGPAIVEVWYPDSSQNGKPSWGDALRKTYVPAGIKGTFLDAQGFTWKYRNNSACRHVSKHHFDANPRTPVSRATLVNQGVARFQQA